MAARPGVRPPLGFTRLGPGEPGKCSGVIMTDNAGNDFALWFRQDGDLVTGDPDVYEDPAFDPETDGTVVGGQS